MATLSLVGERVLVPPTWAWVPEHYASSGSDAVELAETLGVPLDLEQVLVLDGLFAEHPDGGWVAQEAGVIACRQNLKTHVLEVAALTDLFVFGAGIHVWTAHKLPTALEAFLDFDRIIGGSDWASSKVLKVSKTNGEESFTFKSGQRLRFAARSTGAGRGWGSDGVTFDEALFLSAEMVGSITPTTATKVNPQTRYGSSAGVQGSEVLRAVRNRGRKGGDPGLVYFEWSDDPDVGECATFDCDHAYGVEGCRLDDVERWRKANPALDRRIPRARVRGFRRAMVPKVFAREFMGWWDDPADAGKGIDLELWALLATDAELPSGAVTLGLDFATHATSSAIVACSAGIVEVIEHRKGSAWVPGVLGELQGDQDVLAVGADPVNVPGAIEDELTGLGVEWWNGAKMTHAVTSFMGGVRDREFEHRAQASLTDAVRGARLRNAGDASRWSRRDSTVDISPLVAATIARQLWVENDYDVLDTVPDI